MEREVAACDLCRERQVSGRSATRALSLALNLCRFARADERQALDARGRCSQSIRSLRLPLLCSAHCGVRQRGDARWAC